MLEGRVAIVTGAAQGLGREYAVGLAGAGARVVITDIADLDETRALVEVLGAEVLAVKGDVSSRQDTAAVVEQTMNSFSRVDALVNNAAIYASIEPKPFTEIGDDEWDKVMAVNVRGAFLMATAVAPAMVERSYGKIINISSATALMGIPGSLQYVTSKAALFGLTKGLARELGPSNVCVNTVTPGFTMSPGSKQMAERHPELALTDMALLVQALKRNEQPSDLVGTILFLCSAASDFITGQVINVDGGTYMY